MTIREKCEKKKLNFKLGSVEYNELNVGKMDVSFEKLLRNKIIKSDFDRRDQKEHRVIV